MKRGRFTFPYSFRSKEDPTTLDADVVVVSIFGKSSYKASGCKINFVDKLLDYDIFYNPVGCEPPLDMKTLCCIEGYYDKKTCVIYLHLRGMYDSYALCNVLEEFSTKIKEQGFLNIWSDLKYKYAKALLFLFSVSHVVILTHPSPVFDLSYVHLFKALDVTRMKLRKTFGEILRDVDGVPTEFIDHGRLCSPRLLFYFEKPLSGEKSLFEENCKNIKILEHAMEEQIYDGLLDEELIEDITCDTLFAIPTNQEFVFVETAHNPLSDWATFCVNGLIQMCLNPNYALRLNHCDYTFESLTDMEDVDHNVGYFLKQHINKAFTTGFDDNFGEHTEEVNVFKITSARVWFECAHKLYDLLLEDKIKIDKRDGSNEGDALQSLRALLNTDQRFSDGRCKKVYPLAVKTYEENLPDHYTKSYHESKVSDALAVFFHHCKGPMIGKYIDSLKEECEKHWKSGRQMCEVLSLTGNPCNLALHRGGTGDFSANEPDESVDLSELPTMEHCSGVRYVSTCNCGRRQDARDDPFSIRLANYEFYQKIGEECGCKDFEKISFPIFTPSIEDYKPAQIIVSKIKSEDQKTNSPINHLKNCLTAEQCSTSELSYVYPSCHSIEGISCSILGEERKELNAIHKSFLLSPLSQSFEPIIIDVTDIEEDNNKNNNETKNFIRQASTTEYLPGMLHTESLPGLLPQFSSWSLVCVGSSNIYSHNVGLQEPYSVGFINGTSFLLPWDVTVRLEHHTKEKYWANDPRKSSRNKKKGAKEFNVKIFIGIEYECARGHRFMCSSPDTILKSSGPGLIKDSGNKVTNCDMPLYFPCPCRNDKPLIAQLMRVHIVTPKTPVYITLNPKVQPAPSPCPMFTPGCEKPVQLSQSTYWVLRLPYVYCGDTGPYLPPKDLDQPGYGKLLAGMYGIKEVSIEQQQQQQ